VLDQVFSEECHYSWLAYCQPLPGAIDLGNAYNGNTWPSHIPLEFRNFVPYDLWGFSVMPFRWELPCSIAIPRLHFLRILRLHSEAPRLAMLVFLAVRFVRRILRLQFSRCKGAWEGIGDYRQSLPVIPKIR
jgi:hypothetical protein